MKTWVNLLVVLLTALSPLSLYAAASLGTTNLAEGPAAGMDSIVLSGPGAWVATTNAPWLHLTTANQSSMGSTNVVFSFDVNTGATRSGTLTIAGQTLTIMQAGYRYVAVQGPLTALVSTGLSEPFGVAVDGSGNVYIADSGNDAVKKWSVASNTVAALVPSGLTVPLGVAVDGAGNVFIANTFANTVDEWSASTSNLTTLVSSGLYEPYGVAVDRAGDVYITDGSDGLIDEWSATTSNVTTVVSGLNAPNSIAVDAATNFYIPNSGFDLIQECSAADPVPFTLVSGISELLDVAVDNSGNVYITCQSTNTVQEWVAASQTVVTLISSGINYPYGVAVDGAGNVYVSDIASNAVFELPRAFVDPTPKVESPVAGSDTLPAVLPASENLGGPFAPTSDQPWLSITGVTRGVVSYAFTQNTGAPRTAHINLLGESIPVVQDQMGVATRITGGHFSPNGGFQFSFTNLPGAYITILSTTNVSLPLRQWVPIGTPLERPAGQYVFFDTAPAKAPRFYIIASP